MKRERDREKAEAAAGKANMWVEQPPSPSDDELFAVLGYRVKSSGLADVAEKLQRLEMAMGSNMSDGVSVLSTDTVHYNPSDLCGWVDSMLLEINNTASFEMMQKQIGIIGESSANQFFRFPDNEQTQQHGVEKFVYDEDLRAIPGEAIFSNQQKDVVVVVDDDDSENGNKRMKSEYVDNGGCSSTPSEAAGRPVVMVDSQETGVKLVHTLMACAEAVQLENMKLAGTLLKFVEILAASQVGAMGKVATYFADALSQKIYKKYTEDSLQSAVIHMHFYETGPYLKFAHFTANQAILQSVAGAARVHVIDFSLNQGMQWPALMQALVMQPGGPPAFRLTGIVPPQPESNDALQQVGWKLTQLAETIGIEFEFRGFVANSLADLEVEVLGIRPSTVETVAVNAVFEMHRLLARPGSIERVLESIRKMNPSIVTIVEQEANHNGAVFLDRFNESLHYYSTMFDSLESSTALSQPDSQDLMMTEVYLGRQICNVVAREGTERVERHETLAQWRRRMNNAGFQQAHLGSNAFKEASMLLALFAGGDGYSVEESEGCLMLGWHTRPLIATSAWRLPDADSGGVVVSRQVQREESKLT